MYNIFFLSISTVEFYTKQIITQSVDNTVSFFFICLVWNWSKLYHLVKRFFGGFEIFMYISVISTLLCNEWVIFNAFSPFYSFCFNLNLRKIIGIRTFQNFIPGQQHQKHIRKGLIAALEILDIVIRIHQYVCLGNVLLHHWSYHI